MKMIIGGLKFEKGKDCSFINFVYFIIDIRILQYLNMEYFSHYLRGKKHYFNYLIN